MVQFSCCFASDSQRLNNVLDDADLGHAHQLPHVVILKDTTTVDQALKALAANKILSAPVVSVPEDPYRSPGHVWRAELPLDSPSQLVGFVDVRDILASLLQELGDADLNSMKMLQRVRKLETTGQTFASRMLKDLPVFGLDGEFFPDSQGTASFRDLVIYFLASPEERQQYHNLVALSHTVRGGDLSENAKAMVHRVAVYDSQFHIKNIISQSDVVKFLYAHKRAFGTLAKATVEECGWIRKELITVSPDMSAIAAMQLMQKKGIGAVAVVDKDGRIIGNFSMSEMRTIMAEHFGALAMPVAEFLAMEHGTDFWSCTHTSRRSLDIACPNEKEEVKSTEGAKFTKDKLRRQKHHHIGGEVGQDLVLVVPTTTLLEVLEKMVKNRIHRIYVIDPANKPVGVITCSDILRKVLEYIIQ